MFFFLYFAASTTDFWVLLAKWTTILLDFWRLVCVICYASIHFFFFWVKTHQYIWNWYLDLSAIEKYYLNFYLIMKRDTTFGHFYLFWIGRSPRKQAQITTKLLLLGLQVYVTWITHVKTLNLFDKIKPLSRKLMLRLLYIFDKTKRLHR